MTKRDIFSELMEGFDVLLGEPATLTELAEEIRTLKPATPSEAAPLGKELTAEKAWEIAVRTVGTQVVGWDKKNCVVLETMDDAGDFARAVLAASTPASPVVAQDDARDAARYRWLRNPHTDVALVLDKCTGYVPVDERVPSVGGYHTYEYRAGEELDAAIDAVMSTAPASDPVKGDRKKCKGGCGATTQADNPNEFCALCAHETASDPAP